ncbi:unnamed protein product [Calypogeia fissa]
MTTLDGICGKINDLNRELLGLGVERNLQLARGAPKPVSLSSIRVPDGELAEKATKFAYDSEEESIFNHSMRTFFFGEIIGKDQYPDWHWDSETFYLSCILHDVGLTTQRIDSSVLSFEYDGALEAHQFLMSNGCEKKSADIVFEAIARHTDVYPLGKRTEGTLLSIGASLDIAGKHALLIHEESLRDVVVKYPRLDVATRGAELLIYEVEKKKHQCHFKAFIDMGIPQAILYNPLFAAYDKH